VAARRPRSLQDRNLETQLLVEQLLGDEGGTDRRRLVVRRDDEALEAIDVIRQIDPLRHAGMLLVIST